MTALLAALYLQTGLVYQLPCPTPASQSWGLSRFDRQHVYNPYGTIAVGIESAPERRWSASIELRHTSSLPKKDWGDNSVMGQVKWRPWR